MTILELNFEKGWRGGERQTFYNMTGLRDAGNEVHLLCRKNNPLYTKSIEAGFVTFGFDSVWEICWFLIGKGHNYAILHAQTSQILTYAVLTKLFHRSPVVYSRRVDFVPKGFFTRLKYLLADKILAISKAIQQIVTEFSGRKDVELVSSIVTAQALDKSRAIELLEKKNIQPGTHILGTMAALVQHKDPLTMVEAISELRKIRNDFVFLHFGKGDLEPVVQERIIQLGLQDCYLLMGFYKNVEDFFSILEVYVMSSEQEGLGSSVLDAFLYKVPVVTTRAGGLAELGAGERAMLCDIQDAAAIGKAIHTLLADPVRKEKMTTLALAYVQQQHSMEYIIHRYLNVFNKINRTAVVAHE